MTGTRVATGVVAAMFVILTVAGCSGLEVDGNDPPAREGVEQVPEPAAPVAPAPVAPAPVEAPPAPEPQWECSYSPTYDEDWHNDVLCTNGIDQDRPYLRGWDTYITEPEIMESAREYQDQLNAA